jgi:Amidohydrolase family
MAARAGDGRFIVDAWATDGGGIPRNNALVAGYSFVRLGLLTLPELVMKVSVIPARALGLSTKGHLAAGADADLVVVDPATGSVRCTIARGRVIAREGSLFAQKTAWLCFEEGREAAVNAGLDPMILSRPLQPRSAEFTTCRPEAPG